MVGKKFFITGLPRSMTAWCANFMTTGTSFCYHDGLAGCSSLAEFGKKLSQHEVCGDADSGLPLFYEQLRTLYPDAQWAVIRRPAAEVIDSLVDMPPYHGMSGFTQEKALEIVADLLPMLDAISANPGVLTMNTTDLLTRKGAKALWWHCFRGGFDDVPVECETWNTAADVNREKERLTTAGAGHVRPSTCVLSDRWAEPHDQDRDYSLSKDSSESALERESRCRSDVGREHDQASAVRADRLIGSKRITTITHSRTSFNGFARSATSEQTFSAGTGLSRAPQWSDARWMMLRDLKVTVASERVALSVSNADALLAGRAA